MSNHDTVVGCAVSVLEDWRPCYKATVLHVRLHGHRFPPERPRRHVHVIVAPVEHHALAGARRAVHGRRGDARAVDTAVGDTRTKGQDVRRVICFRGPLLHQGSRRAAPSVEGNGGAIDASAAATYAVIDDDRADALRATEVDFEPAGPIPISSVAHGGCVTVDAVGRRV